MLAKKPKNRPTARKTATCRSWCGRLAAAARGAVCLALRGGTGRWLQQKTVTTRSACSSMCNFQHRVSEVLEGHGVASYTGIDDVGLHAQTFDQYLDHLETK